MNDLNAAIAFYATLLDMKVIERDRWRAPNLEADNAVGLQGSAADGAMLRGSGSYLELWQYHAPEQAGEHPANRGANELGLRHLAIEVDDVDAASPHAELHTARMDRLVELGGSKMGEPNRYGDGAAAVYCRDPFGTIVEFMSIGSTLASLDDL